jgi:glucan phosphoethanolaminetransferase (alkaline phosphatase superfamily)
MSHTQNDEIQVRSTQGRSQAMWLLVPLWALVIGASEYVSRRLDPTFEIAEHFGWTLVGGAMVVTGVLILANRPRNRVGRLILAAGTSFAIGDLVLVSSYLVFQQGNAEVSGLLEALAFSAETLGIPLLVSSLVFFPDETLPSPRWRWIVPALWITGALAVLAPLTNGGWGGEAAEAVRPNPLREVLSPLGDILASGFGLGIIIIGATAATSLIVRFRRTSGTTRQQMKWLAFAALLLIIWIPMDALADRARWMRAVSDFGPLVFTGALIAIALAVLRYRLYEIDRIISRTVSYSLVVALIAAVFFSAVTLLSSLLPTDSPLAVAGSTLAVAALFNPARERIQSWVDRRFNRSRYEAQQVADRFTSEIQDQTDVDSLASGLCVVVEDTLRPVGLGIWISDRA